MSFLFRRNKIASEGQMKKSLPSDAKLDGKAAAPTVVVPDAIASASFRAALPLFEEPEAEGTAMHQSHHPASISTKEHAPTASYHNPSPSHPWSFSPQALAHNDGTAANANIRTAAPVPRVGTAQRTVSPANDLLDPAGNLQSLLFASQVELDRPTASSPIGSSAQPGFPDRQSHYDAVALSQTPPSRIAAPAPVALMSGLHESQVNLHTQNLLSAMSLSSKSSSPAPPTMAAPSAVVSTPSPSKAWPAGANILVNSEASSNSTNGASIIKSHTHVAHHSHSGTNNQVEHLQRSPGVGAAAGVPQLSHPVHGSEWTLRLFRLEDFVLFNTLGTGTFGRVRLARYKTAEKYFAMKIMRKYEIVRLNQIEHVFSERKLLSQLNCPFIIRLYSTFQDQYHLYMLLEYAIGGELFSYLRKNGRFSLEATKFYAAEIVLALEYMHSVNVVYRDLKPENLLLDSRGHMKIADFGFAKVVPDLTWTLCGTPEYLAPEIIQSRGHGKAVDWWALGVLIYEMLSGCPPFYDSTPFLIYEKIIAGKYDIPMDFDDDTADLVRRLLAPDPKHRLGNSPTGGQDVRSHPWFANTDWQGLYRRTVQAPFIPPSRHPGDTGNFERYPEERLLSYNPQFVDPFQAKFVNF